jgi:hypothetical protein
MDYFQSLLLMLLAFKGVLVLVLVLAWAVPKARKRWRSYQRWRAVPVHLRTSRSIRRRSKHGSPAKRLRSTDWVKVGNGAVLRVVRVMAISIVWRSSSPGTSP